MPFFLDRISGESSFRQFDAYLNNQIYLHELHKDVKEVTNYQLIEVRKAIQKNSAQTQSAINNSIRSICGSLEIGCRQIVEELYETNGHLIRIAEGVDNINWSLDELNENIIELNSLIDWKTDLIIEQQRTSNRLLKQITKGVFLTEKKKTNIVHHDQGNVFLKAAIKEGRNSQFYQKAQFEFDKAIENDEYDFLSLKQLGFIYYMRRPFNIEKAEYYFSQSATYASVFSDNSAERDRLRNVAASSLFYASCCNYVLNRLKKAIEQIYEAFRLRPNSEKYKFQMAKYAAADGREAEAVAILRGVIQREKLYSIEALKDQDLITKQSIRAMLDQETKKAINRVESELYEIKKILGPAEGGRVWNEVKQIESEFYPKSYITAMTIIEKNKWKI